LGMVLRLLRPRLLSALATGRSARARHGTDADHARRFVPLPRLLLQPVPSGREIVEHTGLLGLEHRAPHRAGPAVTPAFSRSGRARIGPSAAAPLRPGSRA